MLKHLGTLILYQLIIAPPHLLLSTNYPYFWTRKNGNT
jgi:hypothetical protein